MKTAKQLAAIALIYIAAMTACGNPQQNPTPLWMIELLETLDSAKTEQELYEMVEKYREKWVSIIGYKLDLELIEKVEFKLDDELEKRTVAMAYAARRFLIRYPQSKYRGRMESMIRDAFDKEEDAKKWMEETRRQQRTQ